MALSVTVLGFCGAATLGGAGEELCALAEWAFAGPVALAREGLAYELGKRPGSDDGRGLSPRP